MSEHAQIIANVVQNIGRAIVGKTEQIKLILCCWFAGGHVLLEDNPGTGKTMLARALAKSCSMAFKRVQFTPDLLPSDIMGSYVLNQSINQFQFIPGPLLTTIFLGDEINRATPRTQSALLEAMAERQVTVEGNTAALNPLFFVMATQNPVEQLGTFPLPEAQLDRFMMKVSLGYPTPEDEIAVVKSQNQAHPIESLRAVESEARIGSVRAAVANVLVGDNVHHYALRFVAATRKAPEIRLGASPRATIALIRGAQALALIEGFDYVQPSHVFKLVKPILGHRVLLTPEAKVSGQTAEAVLDRIIEGNRVPLE